MKKEEAQAMVDGVKKYAKNVVGGAKIVGGAVKKVVKKITPNTKKIVDDLFGSPEKDKQNRANAPVGAFGGTNMGEYKLPANVKIKK